MSADDSILSLDTIPPPSPANYSSTGKLRGEYLWSAAYMWNCGDYHCACQQPKVAHWYRNVGGMAPYTFDVVWSGTYACEHDWDQYALTDKELANAQVHLALQPWYKSVPESEKWRVEL